MAFELSSSSSLGASEGAVLLVRDGDGACRPAAAEEVLQAAQALLAQRLPQGEALSSPQAVRDFLRVRLGGLEHEVFAVLWLDAQHRLIAYVELFRGTVSQTAVYPREVAREALLCNASAVVLVHNHPSGSTKPSKADELLTRTLRTTLAMVDVTVLDHLVVGASEVVSFAECGLL